MPSWTTEVTEALAQLLAAETDAVWNPTGVYAAADLGIFVQAVPATPDRCITITPYTVTEAAASDDVVQGFQIRCRGGKDPRDVTTVAETVRDVLHGRRTVTLGPAVVPLIWRQSHTSLGVDGNGRWQTSSNFYAPASHPSAHTDA